MHRPEFSRFEFSEGETLAVCEYTRRDGALDLHHTLVPEAFRGRGIAAQLAKEALEYARASGLKVIPSCSYIATYLDRHPEYAGLRAGK